MATRISRLIPAAFFLKTAWAQTTAPTPAARVVAAGNGVLVKSDGTQTPQKRFPMRRGGRAAAPLPRLDLGASSDRLYVSLFGTGMRNFTQNATATIGGVNVNVAGPVAQGQYLGLDQVNLGPLPRSLAGKGEQDAVLTVDGKQASVVTVRIR